MVVVGEAQVQQAGQGGLLDRRGLLELKEVRQLEVVLGVAREHLVLH